MIDSIRNTVLAILNKNNYGYLSPGDYNLFCKQAQLDIFEDIFYQYNNQINKENVRMSGVGYANITMGIEEDIELFSVTSTLVQISANTFTIPSNCYLLNKILTSASREVEKVTHHKITTLLNSNLTAPTETYPAYTVEGSTLTAYPTTLNQPADIVAQYIRYPADPKWTYVSLVAGEPLFDQSANDYQDFELSLSYEPTLIRKILEYAGVTIREEDVRRFADLEDKETIE